MAHSREAAESAAGSKVLALCGCWVYSTEQGYRKERVQSRALVHG